jgi:cytochrome c oxidase subunit 1
MNEVVGKLQFWLFVIGFNMTFMPQHWIGLLGMPRRTFTYSAELHLGGLNLLSSVGVIFQATSILLLIANLIYSVRRGRHAPPNPWGAATLEWATASPPAEHNFNRLPHVHTRDPLWIEAEGIEDAARGALDPHIHMPPPSYWPVIAAMGAVMTMVLFMTGRWWAPLIGLAWLMIAVINWAYEPGHEG